MNQSQQIAEVLDFKSRFADDDDLTPAFKKKLASLERKVRNQGEIDKIGEMAVRATWDFGVFIWNQDPRKYPRSAALKIFPATGDRKAEKQAEKEAEKRYEKGENTVHRSIPT